MAEVSTDGAGPVLSARTTDRLARFASLLRRWNPAINLVARASLDDLQRRHIDDSLQILRLRDPAARSWLDLGSGGGFPGLVVAIALAELDPGVAVTLMEADRRKAEFLRTVSRETEVPVTVLADRIETLPPQGAGTLSARALAPLSDLCGHAARHLLPSGRAIFLKGGRAEAEITDARRLWQFEVARHPSQTDPAAQVLVLSGIRHA